MSLLRLFRFLHNLVHAGEQLGLIFVLSFLFFWACQDGTQKSQPEEAGTAGAVGVSEQAVTTTVSDSARVPTEAEADSLWQLEQQIMQQPENIELRREFGRRALDAGAGVIWTVGQGRVNPKATNSSVAANQAEMAAKLDASRWAAYLIEWQKTNYAAPFGSLQSNVPGATVVRKKNYDSLCVILARVSLNNKP
jgi:hypothetical protein